MTQATAQKNPTDDKKVTPPQDARVTSGQKEAEPANVDANFEKEGKLLTEIKEVSTEADRKAERVVTEELGKIGEKARTIEATANIPEDVKNAGVRDIASEASDVIDKGTTLNLDITEDEYREGLKANVGGTRSVTKSILNVSSIVALAIWIGRQIKKAHGKTMKIVFKRGEK